MEKFSVMANSIPCSKDAEMYEISINFSFSLDLSMGCNSNCSCGEENMNPVCVDNVNYFSPCHAGCQKGKNMVNKYC